MDYAKIYAAFIADRKTKPDPIGFSERHHIIPKSLGGSDEPENIIRLTPEEHYFAHLCLAQIHGGDQWLAVHCMASMVIKATRQRNRLASRAMVGVARRKAAEHKSARMTGQRREWRDKVGTLHRRDGSKVTGSRTHLAEVTGISIASVSRLLNGRQAEASGWFASRDVADEVKQSRRERGFAASRNIAGRNSRSVQRLQCGTIYATVTLAASRHETATGNIARAIRNDGMCAGSRWRYAEAKGAQA